MTNKLDQGNKSTLKARKMNNILIDAIKCYNKCIKDV